MKIFSKNFNLPFIVTSKKRPSGVKKAGIFNESGLLFRLANSVCWGYFSKSGVYYQISDTRDLKTLQNPWVKVPPEQARQFFSEALLIKERMDRSEIEQVEGLHKS